MGIVVKSINKNGNKIVDYVCDLNGSEVRYTRDQLIDKINNREVDNARIQIYKDQIIIRVNTDKVAGATQRQTGQTKTNNKKTTEKDNSAELIKKVANNFKLSHIEAYSNFFFQNNPAMVDREYTIDNIDVKIADMREMVRFCRLVALKQLNDTYDKYSRDLDELEFIDYCKKNNLDSKGEPLC